LSRFSVLILAAGKGTRMKQDIPKQFLEIEGKPLFLYSVEAFLPLMDEVLVVTGKNQVDIVQNYLEKFQLQNRVRVLIGGKERFDSSFAGIDFLQREGRTDYVLVHDAARCFVTKEIIGRCMEDVQQYGTSVCAIPTQDTIKVVGEDGFVVKTLNRKELQTIQTPQGFSLNLLHQAYLRFFENPDNEVTDDASIIEKYSNQPVHLTMGAPFNSKVTTAYDLFIAKAWFSLTNENETFII